MISDEFIAIAGRLSEDAKAGLARPGSVRRSISTSYYAVFHALCDLCAEELVGDRSTDEWRIVYRSLEHAQVRNALTSLVLDVSDPSLGRIAGTFSNLQLDRHAADYDPVRAFTVAEADAWLVFAAEAVEEIARLSRPLRKALAVRLIFKARPVR